MSILLPVHDAWLYVGLENGACNRLSRGHTVEDFLYTAGILRLSTKYFIAHLRAQAIQYLAQIWPNTLRGHDDMIEMAVKSPLIDDKTYPYVHPLHVLNLARAANIQIVVPSILYMLSLYPLTDILAGDHPKLRIDHPSCPISELSPQDIQAYTLMYQGRIDMILDFLRQTCGDRVAAPGCQNSATCIKAFTRLSSILSRTWEIRTNPLTFMVQVSELVAGNADVCAHCKRAFRQDVTTRREDIWRRLPSIVGLPSWEALQAIDLPKP